MAQDGGGVRAGQGVAQGAELAHPPAVAEPVAHDVHRALGKGGRAGGAGHAHGHEPEGQRRAGHGRTRAAAGAPSERCPHEGHGIGPAWPDGGSVS